MTAPLPKLRSVEAHPFLRDGQPFVLLRDPLGLTDKVVVIPQDFTPVLALCDGTRNVDRLVAALLLRFGIRAERSAVAYLLTTLDEALLLDNQRFAEALADAIEVYRSAPFRAPVLAGESYPSDPAELRSLLQGYVDELDSIPSLAAGCRGLVTPHIDYARGGPTYAQVWTSAADAARGADLVILLGTDHAGGERSVITLTRQNYATPYGVLPTAQDVVDELVAAMGPDLAFADELNHRREHSIELAAVWLHHILEGQPCEVLPILAGSFFEFVEGEAELEQDQSVHALTDTLRGVIAGRRALVVAAADLAHVGPAFDGPEIARASLGWLRASDAEIIAKMCAGDAGGFFDVIRRMGDQTNVCGLPPIYIALQLLQPCDGQLLTYDQCPADEHETSWVSICGVTFE
jgi:AmmeMemoRadiSam system protein B